MKYKSNKSQAMGKNKMIAKSCPKCEMQVAVASKSCKCGHTFFAARRAADALPAVEDIRRRTSRVRRSQTQFYDSQNYEKHKRRVAVASKSCKCGHTFFAARRAADALPAVEDIRRRTSRVRRSQTQFYDSQNYEKHKRRSPKKRSLSRSIDEEYKKEKSESATARARRRRALRRAAHEAPPAGERARDPTPQLRPAQLARCSLILQEINRKMRAVTWAPPTHF